ncbi:hypothetical protein BX600DRAFT_435293 [Xylariales sp. PMI_506]|nr:hypothetical protein BX600DRAFT_435293 [Xylariales sp. PMI_506]
MTEDNRDPAPGSTSVLPTTLADELNTTARSYSKQIFTEWNTLKDIVLRHEDTLQKRWLQKSKVKRRAILKQAWGEPAMAQSHRPNIAAFRAKLDNPDLHQDRQLFLWPTINLEDLSKPEPLLLLLSSRSNNSPDKFADADLSACRIGITSLEIVQPMLEDHIMVLHGCHTPETYGQIVPVYERQAQRTLFPADGLTILEIQARMYKFLVACCELILHDKDRTELLQVAVPPPKPKVNESKSITTLATANIEALYRLPPLPDFQRLQSIITARMERAQDHLWMLREDPGYFAQSLLQARDHRREMLPDEKGNTDPLTKTSRQETLWKFIACDSISHPMATEKITTMCTADKESTAYTSAIQEVRWLLWKYISTSIPILKEKLLCSPPVRNYVVKKLSSEAGDFTLHFERKLVVKHRKTLEDLIWILTSLCHGERRGVLSCRSLMTELEFLLKEDVEGPKLTTEVVDEHLADLNIYTECIYQLDLAQPWASAFETCNLESDTDLQTKLTAELRSVTSLRTKDLVGDLVDLIRTPELRFAYPASGRSSKEKIDSMRQAEANLDTFWIQFLSINRRKRNLPPRVESVFRRELKRTPKWEEPRKQMQIQFGSMPPIIIEVQPTKSDDCSQCEDLEPRRISVDTRAAKVFDALFLEPSTGSAAVETRWGDLLHAMVCTGFTAEKLGGWLWQFTPAWAGVWGTIQFHEPHPDDKIPHVMARQMAKRLSWMYEWNAQSFEIKSADKGSKNLRDTTENTVDATEAVA